MTKAEAVLEVNSESTKNKKSTETNSNMGVSTKGAPTSEAALVVKLQEDQAINDEAVVNGSQDVKPVVVKRGRGRPRKSETLATPPASATTTPTGARGNRGSARGRGRPPRGTPSTTPTPTEEPKKRGRGRPPKCKEVSSIAMFFCYLRYISFGYDSSDKMFRFLD